MENKTSSPISKEFEENSEIPLISLFQTTDIANNRSTNNDDFSNEVNEDYIKNTQSTLNREEYEYVKTPIDPKEEEEENPFSLFQEPIAINESKEVEISKYDEDTTTDITDIDFKENTPIMSDKKNKYFYSTLSSTCLFSNENQKSKYFKYNDYETIDRLDTSNTSNTSEESNSTILNLTTDFDPRIIQKPKPSMFFYDSETTEVPISTSQFRVPSIQNSRNFQNSSSGSSQDSSYFKSSSSTTTSTYSQTSYGEEEEEEGEVGYSTPTTSNIPKFEDFFQNSVTPGSEKKKETSGIRINKFLEIPKSKIRVVMRSEIETDEFGPSLSPAMIGEGGFGKVFLGQYLITDPPIKVAIKEISLRIQYPNFEDRNIHVKGNVGRNLNLNEGWNSQFACDNLLSKMNLDSNVVNSFLFDSGSHLQKLLESECELLSTLVHPNIISVHGWTRLSDRKIGIITEYMAGGSLQHYIVRQRLRIIKNYKIFKQTYISSDLNLSNIQIDESVSNKLSRKKKQLESNFWIEKYELVCKMCQAVEYIHGKGILHRDLKPTNFFISEDGKILKLGDFGFAKLKSFSSNYFSACERNNSSSKKGTCRYMSNELFYSGESNSKTKDRYSKYSDIYSLGMSIFEICNEEVPFQSIVNDFVVMKSIVDGKRPKIKSSVPRILQNVIFACWKKNPFERAKIGEILKYLRNNKKMFLEKYRVA